MNITDLHLIEPQPLIAGLPDDLEETLNIMGNLEAMPIKHLPQGTRVRVLRSLADKETEFGTVYQHVASYQEPGQSSVQYCNLTHKKRIQIGQYVVLDFGFWLIDGETHPCSFLFHEFPHDTNL